MQLRRDPPYRFLLAAALLWTSLALVAPWARARGWPGSEALYALFAPVCHQRPERSFLFFGEAVAACHRCLGLYLGLVGGLLLLPWLPRLTGWLAGRPRVVLVFFAPLGVDVALPFNTPLSRLATGWIAAFPMALFVWAAAEQIWRRARESRHSSQELEVRS